MYLDSHYKIIFHTIIIQECKMKTAFIIYEFPPYVVGGLGTYAKYVTRELIRRGHHVTAFSMHTREAPIREVLGGVEVHRPIVENINLSKLLPMFIPEEIRNWPEAGRKYFGDVFLYNLLSASKLVNDLVGVQNKEIDLVAAHDWLGSVGGILASNGLGKPLVFHVHSTEQGRAGKGSECVKKLEMMGAEYAERIITVSHAMQDHLVQLGYDQKKIRVIYNGIDVEKYCPKMVSPQEIRNTRRRLGIKKDEFMILFLGRLTWIKGADVLLRSMPKILSRVPKAKLVIVGVGGQQELLKQEVTRLGLEGQVILKFEFLPEDEKIRYYAASDLCVFPSKYEPFGIVCTEAMALGKPVIVGAKDVSGFREQVVPSGSGQCGFHINPYDPNDIAEFVVRLLEDEMLRVRCGENARKRVVEMFTWSKVAEDTVRVYRDVMLQS